MSIEVKNTYEGSSVIVVKDSDDYKHIVSALGNDSNLRDRVFLNGKATFDILRSQEAVVAAALSLQSLR